MPIPDELQSAQAKLKNMRYLRGFDVVMEIVSECLNMRYTFLPSLCGEMTREEDYILLVLVQRHLHGRDGTESNVANLAF
jgi:hypothetical protein